MIEPFPRNTLYRQIAADGPNHHDGISIRDVNPEALRQLLAILSENYEKYGQRRGPKDFKN